MEPPLPDAETEQARTAVAVAAANPLIERSLTMAAFPFPASAGRVSFNDPAIQAAQIPGANGISAPWSLARLYAACVSEIAGVGPLLTPASLDDAMLVRSAGPQLSGMPDDGGRWGSGFQVSSPPFTPMLGPGSFGHAGAGGQLGFADRDHRLGFSYLGNQMGGYGDARARALTEALGTVLRG
jgi:CubicO group peptidase (beta-lactamase class C family)